MIKKRIPNLLSLLESHAGTTVPQILVIPKPLTPIIPTPIQIELADKKGKRDRKGGKRIAEDAEVQEETSLEPTKVTKMTCTQQRKGVESSGIAAE